MNKQGVYEFYRDRILSCPNYGFKSGEEILQVIRECATHDINDSFLTIGEYNTIINLCQQAHIIMMEDNYNAGWQDE